VPTGWVRRRPWLQAGVLLVTAPLMLLAAAVPAGAAAAAPATSHSPPDRAPGEVALLVVCGAVLIAVAAALIRRGRVRRWRPGRALLDAGRNAVRTSRRTTPVEVAVGDGPDDGQVCDSLPGPAQLDAAPDGCSEEPGPDGGNGDPGLDGWSHDPAPDGWSEEPGPDAVEDGDDTVGSVRWRPQAGVLVPAAGVILLACGMGMAVVMGGSGHDTASRSSAAAGVDPTLGQLQTASASATASPRPGKQPAKGAHAAASPGPGTSPGHGDSAAASGSGSAQPGGSGGSGSAGSGSSAPGGSGTSAPAGPPPPGTLEGLPSSFVPCTAASDSALIYTCSFSFTAEGGPVSYTVSAPDDPLSDFGIAISNASGTLAAGQQATVTATVTVEGQGGLGNAPTEPNVTVNPGGITVGLDVPPPG
jgi:uncharacterized membrane protein YgcG